MTDPNSSHISFRELSRALETLGFEIQRIEGSHFLFRHPPTETIVLLPLMKSDELVSETHLRAVRQSVVGRRVADAGQFDDLLAALHA